MKALDLQQPPATPLSWAQYQVPQKEQAGPPREPGRWQEAAGTDPPAALGRGSLQQGLPAHLPPPAQPDLQPGLITAVPPDSIGVPTVRQTRAGDGGTESGGRSTANRQDRAWGSREGTGSSTHWGRRTFTKRES